MASVHGFGGLVACTASCRPAPSRWCVSRPQVIGNRQKPGLRHLLDEKGNAQAGPIVVHKITSMVVCRPAARLLRQEERPLMVVMDITIIQSALGG